MDLLEYFRLQARYNRVANERLYERCARLDDAAFRRLHCVSFGSVHGLLNHLLLGDRVWMSRFEGAGGETPALDTILCDEFAGLRKLRVEEHTRIEGFFDRIDAAFLDRTFPYVNNQGKPYREAAPVAVGHFFNHQTHHRGQVHSILSQSLVDPPSLDLHRILNP